MYMTTVNATTLRANLFDYLNIAATTGDVVNVTTKNGNVIMLSEDEYSGMQETLYLLSIPGLGEKLVKAATDEPEEFVDFEW
jgi:prevent-host-death family protein